MHCVGGYLGSSKGKGTRLGTKDYVLETRAKLFQAEPKLSLK